MYDQVLVSVFLGAACISDNTRDAVLQAFHILNAFDVPLGAVRASEDGGMIAEYTTWTSAADLKDLTYPVLNRSCVSCYPK